MDMACVGYAFMVIAGLAVEKALIVDEHNQKTQKRYFQITFLKRFRGSGYKSMPPRTLTAELHQLRPTPISLKLRGVGEQRDNWLLGAIGPVNLDWKQSDSQKREAQKMSSTSTSILLAPLVISINRVTWPRQ